MIKYLTIPIIVLALLAGCTTDVTQYDGKVLSKHTEDGRFGSVFYYAKIVYDKGSGQGEIDNYKFDTEKQYESVNVGDKITVYATIDGIEEISK